MVYCHRPNKRSYSRKTATHTSRKIVLEPPLMLIQRYYLNFLKWVCLKFQKFLLGSWGFLCFVFFFQKNWLWVWIWFLKAITLCPNVPVYLTNRALCHRKRKYVRALTLFKLHFAFQWFFFLLFWGWIQWPFLAFT